MYNHTVNQDITVKLQKWYNINKRDLPWRNTTDPYIIWISEIILQQTRVDQGYAYFIRFIDRFPDVISLANAEEDEVLKLWQGLGYYSRARNLHAAAKDVKERFNGVFPNEYKDILSLKGIGDYTAAAITSFAHNQPYAVLDGNVFRVLSRLFMVDEPINTGKGKKLFAQLAQSILDIHNPGNHNQAIMELGALQCVPNNPVCEKCPLIDNCLAFISGTIPRYPVKERKIVVKNRYFNYFDIRYKGYTYIVKRINNDIWKNLYELPLIETDSDLSIDNLLQSKSFGELFGNNELQIKHIYKAKHVLSHRNIFTNFYEVFLSKPIEEKNGILKIKQEEIHNYPVSRLVHKYLENI